MAEIQEIRIPDIGDVEDVTVAEVLVAVDQEVTADESLIVLESDKASMDVPAPKAGRVVELKVAEGDKVAEGTVILTLAVAEVAAAAPEADKSDESDKPDKSDQPDQSDQSDESDQSDQPDKSDKSDKPDQSDKSDQSDQPDEPDKSDKSDAAPPAPTDRVAANQPVDEGAFRKAHASPAVRRYARELGVDLGRVEGSGRKERITRGDVQGFVKATMAARASSAADGVSGFEWPAVQEIDFSKFGPVETKPLARIRKLSAHHVHRSWLHMPHVTQHDEADVTEMEAFRRAHSEEAKRQGFKLTPVAFLLKASAAALAAFPEFNASLDTSGENLILKGYCNVGVAVDTPGGLVVPVIRDVDRKGIFELAQELLEVSGRAREGKLLPQDFQGGCFTISSLGGIGGTAFTPIINGREVAILGVSRSRMTPVWQDGEFVPRLMLPLSLSYDHRVIDGASAARFVVHLGRLLADIRRLLL